MTCILFIKGFVSKGGRQVKDYIEERAMEIAEYIINEKATVRQLQKFLE
jgi:nucleoid-associated protein YejK